MSKELKLDVMNNKNDLIEGTFCYSLFERSFFDEKLLSDLINNSEAFLKENECDKDVLNLLSWIVNGVDQCFTSHNDENDYYLIENCSVVLENRWVFLWRSKIDKIIGGN
ncbi:hypothetical protein ACSJL3_002431 [Serratia nevei]|uniref:hypothetical protein n=1 Tax=Serratia nevei TaxID=2703794 RepID=UPI002082C8A4|nr:hypothetical protein TUM17560_06420 [Serratia marcescens]